MQEHLQGTEVVLHAEEGPEAPRGPCWMPENLQGAEVVLHGEESPEASRGPCWMPEHLQGTPGYTCPQVQEDLLSVWRDRTQQAHLQSNRMPSMCHPHRHTDHGNPREAYFSSNPILECSVMMYLQKKRKRWCPFFYYFICIFYSPYMIFLLRH